MGKKNSNIKQNIKKTSEPVKNPVQKSKLVKVLNVCVLIGLVILLFYAPFFRGLYFNEEMSTTFLYTGLLFLAFIIKKLFDKDFKIIKAPLDIAAILLVLVYALPIMLGIAASAQEAWDKFLRYINYFFIYLICRDIIKEDKNIKIILNAILVSALGVCILGVDAGAGGILTNKINWFIKQIPVWLQFQQGAAKLMDFKFFGGFAEGRIFSTLQYPNVLASYLGAVFLLISGLLMVTRSYLKRAWYGAAGFIVFYTFILTGSRGMVLVLPLMVLILFISFRNKKHILSFTVDAFVPIVAGVSFSAMYGNYVNAGQYSKVWITIIIGAFISAVLTSIIQRLKRVLFAVSTKIYVVTAASVVMIFVVLVGFALNIEKPLLIKHDVKEAASQKIVVRDITNIKPSAKYILNFDVDALSNEKNEEPYSIIALGMDKFANLEQLAEIKGKTEKARKSMEFTTKDSTRTLRIQLQNYIPNTSASFSNFVLKDVNTGKEKKLIIQYKYLPTDLIYKIQDISLQTHNAWQRLIFVNDAFRIIGAYPFGTGGGGWKALYHQYQSYEYASNEVHNYPVQLWVETGILGISVLIGTIVLIIHHYRKVRLEKNETETEGVDNSNRIITASTVFVAILSLYAHSIIDFDFSLSAVPITAWALTGILAGMYILRKDYKGFEIKIYDSANKKKYKDFTPSVNYCASTLIAILMIMLIAAGINSLNGRSLIAKASILESTYAGKQPAAEDLRKILPVLIPSYSEYLKIQPLDEKRRQTYVKYLNMYQMLAQNLSKEQRDEIETQLRDNIKINVKNEPNSFISIAQAASFLLANGKFDEGLAYADNLVVMERFIADAYYEKAQLYIIAGENAVQLGDKGKAKVYFKKASEIKNEFEETGKKSLKPVTTAGELDQAVSQAKEKLAKLGGV
ncbi:MAG: hypothetical protein ACM3KR_00260 [Deltaproteobacteria bacterium]